MKIRRFIILGKRILILIMIGKQEEIGSEYGRQFLSILLEALDFLTCMQRYMYR